MNPARPVRAAQTRTDAGNADRRPRSGSLADSKRLNAIAKLPRDLNGKLYVMCIQAIIEGDGDLPADPLVLLGVNSDDFYGLADRAGIDAKYKYKLFKHWMANAA